MRKFITPKFFLVLSLLAFLQTASAQVIIGNTTTPYTQDFNTLAATGTSAALPTGWALLETGTGANTTYAADNGGLNSGNTYSYGTVSATDRALGGLLSGSVTPYFGVQFTNNSGSTITDITIAYTGEQWRLGATGRIDRLDFQYSLNATTLATASGAWNDVNNLDFTAPATTGTIGALDGNASPNRSTSPITFTISGLSIPSGSSFWLRWVDFNPSGADDGLAIDDFSASFNGSSVPACTAPTAPATALTLSPGVTTVTGSFTPNASATDEYLVLRSTASVLTQLPTNGTAYTTGQVLGNAVVRSAGSATSINDVALNANTTYYYFVFAYNEENCSGGPNYLSASENGSVTTASPAPCTTPAATVSNLVLTAGSTSISGTFTAAAGANRYLTVRSLNPTITFVPTNGITYSAGQTFGTETIVAYTANTNFSASGLTANTTYYFFIFSANGDCSGEPFYGSGTTDGSQTTLAAGGGIPAGYYNDVTTQNCNDLKTVLFNIIKPTTANPAPDYAGICSVYATTDMKKSDDGARDIIWDMYSDNPTGPDPYEFEYGVDVDGCGGVPNNPAIAGTSEGRMYNREHSFPRNWFGGAVEPMNSDIMHIFPTDKEVNARRGNLPYGVVSTPTSVSLNGSKVGPNSTSGFSGTVFEPINEYKGDFARVQFYMITAYENLVAGWAPNKPEILDANSYPVFDSWYLNLLYQWHLNDPVSAKEIDRNNAVYAIQGNRNPYVDHPEYLARVLTCSGIVPVTLTSFTGTLRNNTAVLVWTATQETNFKTYEIERSTNGVTFEKIGSVEGHNLANYGFTDQRLPQKNVIFYRLKMLDIDGKFQYSNIIALKLNNDFSNAFVYPNPAKGTLNIQLFAALTVKSNVQVTDITGRLVKRQTAAQGELNIPLDVQELAPGRYFIKISNPDQVINQSFVIVK
jgi:endonuclease I